MKTAIQLCILASAITVFHKCWNFVWLDLQKGEAHEFIGYSIGEFIQHFDYPFESHTITTKDGYILDIQRIPYGVKPVTSANEKRPAVLLLHGFATDAYSWIIAGPKYALPFILADNGYDVWMMNLRGTRYGQKHIKWSADMQSRQFYNFTLLEAAVIDVPTTIDYILEKTGHEKLFYVGQSQGATSLFGLLSEKPEYNDKIHVAALFAPVMYGVDITVPIFNWFSNWFSIFKWTSDLIGLNTLSILPGIARRFIARTSANTPSLQKFYSDIGAYVLKLNSNNFDMSLIPLAITMFPCTTGIKQMFHMLQNIHAQRFQKYDYGLEKNIQVYGSRDPPAFDTFKITAPLALYIGEMDAFTHPLDVQRMLHSLRNETIMEKITLPEFTHYDFCISTIAKDQLYPRVIKLFNKYIIDSKHKRKIKEENIKNNAKRNQKPKQVVINEEIDNDEIFKILENIEKNEQ